MLFQLKGAIRFWLKDCLLTLLIFKDKYMVKITKSVGMLLS